VAESTHEVFGDESIFNNAIVYGVAVIPVKSREVVEQKIFSLKEENGVPGNTEIHCKDIFHPIARTKTEWNNLDNEKIEGLLSAIAIIVRRSEGFFQIGFIDKRQWPKILPAEKDFPETPVGDKLLCGFAFQAAIAPLEGSIGTPNIRLFIDYDQTKIPWFGKKRQAHRNYRGWSGVSKQWIEPEPRPEQKPPLLELADIVAYVSTHALCVQEYERKAMFGRLYQVFSPIRGILNPSPEITRS